MVVFSHFSQVPTGARKFGVSAVRDVTVPFAWTLLRRRGSAWGFTGVIILLRSLSSNHVLGGESVLLQNSIYEFALRRTNDAFRYGRLSSSAVKVS